MSEEKKRVEKKPEIAEKKGMSSVSILFPPSASARDLWRDAGSLLDLSGTWAFHRRPAPSAEKNSDTRVLAEDWAAIGNDFWAILVREAELSPAELAQQKLAQPKTPPRSTARRLYR